jgi:hypothetical protein
LPNRTIYFCARPHCRADRYALDNYDIMAVHSQVRHLPAKMRFFIDMLEKVYTKPWHRDASGVLYVVH